MTDQQSVTGVIHGCAVTAQASPDMTVHVAAGRVVDANVTADVAAADVTITTADATDNRLDAIVADDTGALSAIVGVLDPSNVTPPDTSGYVLLAYVYVVNQGSGEYTGTVTNDDILDVRAFVAVTDVQVFESSGSWTPPGWAKFCQVTLYAAGSGGAGGSRSAGGASHGGGGGGGGERRQAIFAVSDLSLPVTVTVGTGGAGGAGKTGSAGYGADGTAGGDSAFGDWPVMISTYLAANSGGAGSGIGAGGDGGGTQNYPVASKPGVGYQAAHGGIIDDTTFAVNGTGWPGEDGGGGGGAANSNANGGYGGGSLHGGGGGGGGSSAASSAGGDGGVPGAFSLAGNTEDNHGRPSAPNATDGSDGSSLRGGVGGGGGGAATGAGGNGSAGGRAGGGGGGGAGGGAANQNGGDGGAGGDGLCIVTSW